LHDGAWLELRAPFLDHRVFNCTRSLPSTVRFSTPPKLFLSKRSRRSPTWLNLAKKRL
jgi:hypothetical protein